MIIKALKLTALLLLFVTVLGACGAPDTQGGDSTEADTVAADTSNDIYIERENKEIKNILMIGNSFCNYYVEELCGIAYADGYEITVANLYKSGAALSEHYNSFTSDTKISTLFVTTAAEGRKSSSRHTVKDTLNFAQKYLDGDWDVISLQGNSYNALIGNLEAEISDNLPYAEKLYNYIRETNPNASLYWHQSWSYEIGYGQDKSGAVQVNTVEHRTSMYETKKAGAYKIAKETGVRIMPTGDAWEIARKNELIGTDMCKRLSINNDEGDYYHDGDIGGGQYLNACVWYEVLFAKSCVGNTWRPDYELSEEKIAILQAAAHEAVAAVYGPGYAK